VYTMVHMATRCSISSRLPVRAKGNGYARVANPAHSPAPAPGTFSPCVPGARSMREARWS
jgi:hypothetical protein